MMSHPYASSKISGKEKVNNVQVIVVIESIFHHPLTSCLLSWPAAMRQWRVYIRPCWYRSKDVASKRGSVCNLWCDHQNPSNLWLGSNFWCREESCSTSSTENLPKRPACWWRILQRTRCKFESPLMCLSAIAGDWSVFMSLMLHSNRHVSFGRLSESNSAISCFSEFLWESYHSTDFYCRCSWDSSPLRSAIYHQ